MAWVSVALGAVILAGLCSVVHAETHAQGTHSQGTHSQGTHSQGTHSQGTPSQDPVVGTPLKTTWLTGTTLTAILAGAPGAAATFVRVMRFRGDNVDAFIWQRELGWSRVELHPRALVGAEWLEHRCDNNGHCVWRRFRIVGAEPDTSRNTMPSHGDNSDVWLYNVLYTSSDDPSTWQNACDEDARGYKKGLFVDGRWNHDGSFAARGYTFSCTGGVIAKCVRGWGYKPWKKLRSRDGHEINLQRLHQTCMRAARADYCGDGLSYTLNNTLIDMFDVYGFNVRDKSSGFSPEATFSERGALSVRRTRWPTGTDKGHGRWATLPSCCRPRSVDTATASQVVIWVWSRLQSNPSD
ncbi:MAG: hypothetical protein MJE77_43060 [Proteobacteria bacterium]|nr:hypothetical protein [Pseudomonadota bacterium]